jgi:preprotein translocase subunit SecG
MLFELLLTLYIMVCVLLILLVLVQKGKSSMGIGNLGGGVQMLFGGSGGQDIFQKVTWGLGVAFMAGSLFLSLLKTTTYQQSRYIQGSRPSLTMPQEPQKPQAPAPSAPAAQ